MEHRYYLIFCDTFPNGAVLSEPELNKLKKQDTSYKTIIPVDTAMVSLVREVI